MATTPKKAKPRTPQQRMASRRERLRAQGLRPVQHWVPDLRDPKVLADIRRQVKLMAKHPENDAIDDWIESVYDSEFVEITRGDVVLMVVPSDLGRPRPGVVVQGRQFHRRPFDNLRLSCFVGPAGQTSAPADDRSCTARMVFAFDRKS